MHRFEDKSLYYTTVVLSNPSQTLIKQYNELGIEPPNMEKLEDSLNNWPHLNSRYIIIARLDMEYINLKGDRSDLNGEMYGAFTNEVNGTYYLDPRFIVGYYDNYDKKFYLSNKFERNYTIDTINKLKSSYQNTVNKTNERLKR